jgi:hypothetical protein
LWRKKKLALQAPISGQEADLIRSIFGNIDQHSIVLGKNIAGAESSVFLSIATFATSSIRRKRKSGQDKP